MSTALLPSGWTAFDLRLHQQAQEIIELSKRQDRLKKQSANIKKLKEDIETLIKNLKAQNAGEKFSSSIYDLDLYWKELDGLEYDISRASAKITKPA